MFSGGLDLFLSLSLDAVASNEEEGWPSLVFFGEVPGKRFESRYSEDLCSGGYMVYYRRSKLCTYVVGRIMDELQPWAVTISPLIVWHGAEAEMHWTVLFAKVPFCS